jgi:hypothetical protein
VSFFAGAVRLRGEAVKYALLAYVEYSANPRGPIRPEVAEVLARDEVTCWMRLQPVDSATTLSSRDGKTNVTDGPFVDSKEYIGGLIVVEAANLDEALEIAAELQEPRTGGAIEVRPIFEDG